MKHEGILKGVNISLRPIRIEDCDEIYLSWLQDQDVNKYLETRWREQSLESIKCFVEDIIKSTDSYLFAIIENMSCRHIGNIKIGPINRIHLYADISYFLGDKTVWGKGYATEAVKLITYFGFTELGLHRVQAGIYENNIASGKCLEKAGYKFEGVLRKQLKSTKGWEDHKYYGILKEEWENLMNENERID